MLKFVEITGKGFQVVKDYNCWRIASLTFDKETNFLNMLKNFGRHNETVEAFILMEGSASIVTGGFRDIPSDYELIKLKKNNVYYVQEKQWHAALLNEDSILLIIENKNTNESNSQKYFLTDDDRSSIIKLYELN